MDSADLSNASGEQPAAEPTQHHQSSIGPTDAQPSNDDDDDAATVQPNSESGPVDDSHESNSFVTARQSFEQGQSSRRLSSRHYVTERDRRAEQGDRNESGSSTRGASPWEPTTEPGSTVSLLPRQSQDHNAALQRQDPGSIAESDGPAKVSRRNRAKSKLARFNVEDNVQDRQQRIRSRVERTQNRISAARSRWSKAEKGELIRAQKMLVRVEESREALPSDFSENASMRVPTREIAKWRQYVVACRNGPDADTPYVLKMYNTRVIEDVDRSRKSAYYEIPLSRNATKVNLYSCLDKTLVMWHELKHRTRIFIVRPRSAADAVEWYTFIRQALGWQRPSSLLVRVPDLDVGIMLESPFQPTRIGNREPTPNGRDPGSREQHAADIIIGRCIDLLKKNRGWSQFLDNWSKTTTMGLAWRRYDRLEWVHGVNEREMYGTIAMQTSHDLELRPKHHYPTWAPYSKNDQGTEPVPVEGFLVRLTSQTGSQKRLGKSVFKRHYFFTYNQFLCFCRPSRAIPPLPPGRTVTEATIPSYREILDQMPLMFDIDPFPIQDGRISWLESGNEEFVRRHDEEAFAQHCRANHNLEKAEGIIDLCQVREIRHAMSSATDQDTDRIMELELRNGLVVKLQAHNKTTRDEWVKRLTMLSRYWKARIAADVNDMKTIRRKNLKILRIDEELESMMGQYASKWEVRNALASPYLFNLCPQSDCRPIKVSRRTPHAHLGEMGGGLTHVKLSGQLYYKSRRRGAFRRCQAILAAGQLLLFQDTLRKRSGADRAHAHKELIKRVDLRDVYLYSGILVENDLLYANQTFDSNRPGHHALPRIYLAQDGLTSRDEDGAICFGIWQPTRKSLFRASVDAEQAGNKKRSWILRRVSALGLPGRSIVFKARNRVERDRWVLCIEAEIDRLQEEIGEDIRIV